MGPAHAGRVVRLVVLPARLRVRARLMGTARRLVRRGPAGLLPDVRFRLGRHPAGGGFVDGGAPPGRCVDGVARPRTWAGALAGVAFAISPKGALVLAACLLWSPGWMAPVGFLLVTAAASGRFVDLRLTGRVLGRGVALGAPVCRFHLRRGAAAQRHHAHAELGRLPCGDCLRCCGGLLRGAPGAHATPESLACMAGDFAGGSRRGDALLPAILLPVVASARSAGGARNGRSKGANAFPAPAAADSPGALRTLLPAGAE